MVSMQWLPQPEQRAVLRRICAASRMSAMGSMADRCPGPAVAGDQGRAERAHDARDIRAGGLDARDAAQRRAARPGCRTCRPARRCGGPASAGIGKLDDLIQRVFDDGVGETRGDILHGRALLLRLLDVGVHEHGAARAKIDGMGGEQRLLRENRAPCSRGNWRSFR